MQKRWRRSAWLWCLLVIVPLAAQEFRATITGRVTDSSQAVVPGAKVEVKNVGTNEVTSARTDNSGNYTAPFLRPGAYTITVEAAGFKKFTREAVVVNVGQAATVDVVLEVGAVTEQVTVTAAAPLLETVKSDRGGVVDRQRVHELPLNARNPFMLGAIVAGVKYTGALIWPRPFDNGAIAEWSVNGSTTRSTEFLLDGAPNNSQAGSNNIAYVPPVDSVQEFKMHTNTYDAQFGKTGGAIVNVSLKSGTNTLHGAAYEFARRTGWDASTFQNNAAGLPRGEHLLDQYGVQMDGPVFLPRLLDGRNKLFFMTNYEGYREKTPWPSTQSVPAPEFLDGDFSKLVNAGGLQIEIFDPQSGRQAGSQWVRDAFPGNRIPANRINPVGRKILSYFPKPNTTTPGVGFYSQFNYFVPNNVSRDAFYNFVTKFDANAGDRHRVFWRYAANRRDERTTESGVIRRGPGQCCENPSQRINDHLTADWVAVLGPSVTFNLRTSFNRYVHTSFAEDNEGFDLTTFGFPAALVSQIPGGAHFGRYEFSDYSFLGYVGSNNYTNTWAVHPTATKIAGAHTLKFGVDIRWIQWATRNRGNPWYFSGSRAFTQRQFDRADALSGNSIASFLLGYPASGTSDYNAFPAYMYRYLAPYIQDDWKVSRRLTLNLGLRWDFNEPPDERFNRLNRGFDAQAISPVDAQVDRKAFPSLQPLRGGLLFAGVGGVSRKAADLDADNIQPRMGLAYELRKGLVFRGGWGRIFINPGNQYLQGNGFSTSTPYVASEDSGRTPLNTLSSPFPQGLSAPPGSSLELATHVGRGFSFVNPDFEIPHVEQFSAGFQWEPGGGHMLEVTYVGSRTRNHQTSRAFNEPDLAFRQKCNYFEGGRSTFCNELLPNPFRGIQAFAGTGHFTNATLSRSALARPFPHFGSLTEQMRNDGAMWYNSLQVSYQARLRHLNILATYTLSKHMERTDYLDVQRNVLQQSLYTTDIPHRLTLANVWELPFGTGRALLNSPHPFLGRLVSGWQATQLLTMQSGRPASLPSGVRYLRDARIKDVDWSAHQVRLYRPCIARQNEDGTVTPQPFSLAYGCGTDISSYNFLVLTPNAPRETPYRSGNVRLHPMFGLDLSISKTTKVTETTSIQFRAEAFNLTNTNWFGAQQPNVNANSADFGTIIRRSVAAQNGSFPRHVQLAVKFLW
ncbi:MAG: TonB-dependent receptor [Acidobacteriota bacterium]